MDTIDAGDGDDTFIGGPGLMVDDIFGDVLDGGEGTDTLNLVGNGGAIFTATNIENINIRTVTGSTASFEMTDVTGVENLTAQSLRGALTLNDVQEISHLAYKNNSQDVDSDLTVIYAPGAVAGADDSLDLTATNNINGGTVSVNGIETVNLTSVGDNVLGLVVDGASLNIAGDGDLDLVADDADTVSNNATATVILSAVAATTIENSGDSLTVTAVADEASVTNSGAGDLTYEALANDVTIENSGSGVLTVDLTGAAVTADVTIINSGEGNTTITGSAATVINSTGAGDLTVEEDAYAAGAIITASGAGALTVTVKDNDASIDASDSTGQVTLNVSTAGVRVGVNFTGSDGDDLVVLGANALVAADLLDGGDGTDTIEVSNDDATLAFTNFAGVTNFETVTYTGTDAVEWTALDALGTDVELEFAAIAADVDDADAGANGAAGAAGAAGGNGANGDLATANATILDLAGVAATVNVVLTEDLSAIGGNGGAGGVGGAGYSGKNATAAAAAEDGTAGGNGGDGSAGEVGATVLTTNATTFTLTLNGVTLDSSGGMGGAGGAGANGGNGGNGFSAAANPDGGDGGAGGTGGAGGVGGNAAVTVSASSATIVNIHSNGDDNALIAAGGAGGLGGAFGLGGSAGAGSGAGAIPGIAGINGLAGVAGAAGASSAGLEVAATAVITIDGDGNLNLGLVAGTDLTIDASELTGSLTIATESGNDVITGGTGANTITLFGGVDNVDISLSEGVADAITVGSAVNTDADFGAALTLDDLDIVWIEGFEVGTDTLAIGKAGVPPNTTIALDIVAVADTNIQLTASDVGPAVYSVYQYRVADGVVAIGKAPGAAGVSVALDAELAAFEDAFNIIFNDVLLDSAEGESVIYTDGTDSWIFVSDGVNGFSGGDDHVIKLVGVEATTAEGILA